MGTAGAKVQDHYQALIQDAAAYVQKEGTKDKKRDYLATELAKAILVNEKKITGATTDFYTGAVPMHSGDPLAKRLIAYCNDLITKKVNADKLDADKLDAPLSEYLKKQILETASQSATEAANYGLTALDPYNPEVFTLVDQQGDPVDEFSDEYVAYIDHLMIKTALTDQEISFLNVAGQKLNTLMINPSVAPHNLGVIHASRELFHIQSSAIPHHLRIINSERLAEYIASGATGNVKLYKNMSAEEDVDPKFLKPIPISLLKLYSRSKEGDTNNAASGSYRQRLKAKLSNDIFQAYDLNNLEEMEESLENATDAYAETRAGHAQYRLLGIMNESREKVEAARNEYLKNLQQTTTSKLIAKFATDNPNVDIINNKTDREAFLLELAEAVSDSRKKVVELERAHRTSTLPEGLENLITTHPWMATAISLGTIALAGGVAAATLTAAPWVATAAAGVAGVVAGITTWKGVSSLAQRVGGSIFGFNKKVSSEDILKIPKNTTIEAANDKIAKGIAMHDNKMYSERWKESFATTERMVNTDSSKLLMHALRERAKLANPMLSRPNTHAERIKFIAEMVAVAINQENYLNSKVEENKRYLQGIRASSDVIGGFAGIASGIGAYSAVNAIGSWINGLFTPTPPVTPGPVPPTPTPGSWAFKVPDNATSVLKFGNPDPGFLEILKESLSPLNLTDQQLHSIWNQHMGSLTDSSGNLLSGRAAGPLGNAGVDLIRDGELISGPGMDNMVQAYATASGTTVPQVQALLTF
ncbi:hypothetical protein COY06_00655 [Candidatus Peregrinibacteria bacterium CG_4_10_14_0_2_um_filter_41_8]|nr:MAG: hypothetical protein COY06_00655 [Candidatus Peregrinibacteria bacterium CG_4_10_14_0_2_um_filter_41_8]